MSWLISCPVLQDKTEKVVLCSSMVYIWKTDKHTINFCKIASEEMIRVSSVQGFYIEESFVFLKLLYLATMWIIKRSFSRYYIVFPPSPPPCDFISPSNIQAYRQILTLFWYRHWLRFIWSWSIQERLMPIAVKNQWPICEIEDA